MNSHTALVFPAMKKEYCQIAFGVKSLRDAYDGLFMDKVKRGLKVKFITVHPNSIFLEEREKIENKQAGEIRKTIIDLIQWIEKLKSNTKRPDNIQIKFYDSLPLDFYCKIDDNLYVGPYYTVKKVSKPYLIVSPQTAKDSNITQITLKHFGTALWWRSLMR